MEVVSEYADENIRVSDFVESLSFVDSLVASFANVDHHPDVHVSVR